MSVIRRAFRTRGRTSPQVREVPIASFRAAKKQQAFSPITSGGFPQCCWQVTAKLRQILEQGLSLLQIERIEAFGEPTVDRREADRRPPPAYPDRARAAPCLSLHAVPMTWPGLLLTCDRERTLEIILRFGRVGGSTAREVALLLFQLGEARLIAARSSHAIIKRIMKPTLVGRGTKEEKPAEE